MKPTLHPEYYPNAQVTCTCGNTFTTGSTLPEIHVEICSQCHPFFTGEMKFVDTQGRVEKFQAKQKQAAKIKAKLSKKKARKKQVERQRENPQTLKEMLKHVQKQDKSSSKPKSDTPKPPAKTDKK